MSEPTADGGPAPSSSARVPNLRRQRIRNWALLIALLALAGMVYGIAVVRMIQQHHLPHFV